MMISSVGWFWTILLGLVVRLPDWSSVLLADALSLSVRLYQSMVFDSVVCRPTWVKEYFSDKKYLSDLRDKLLLSLMMKMTYRWNEPDCGEFIPSKPE